MKATGIVRRIDELGRGVIPKEIRRTMNLHEGDPLEIFTGDGGITFRKYDFVENVADAVKALKDQINDDTDLKDRSAFLRKISELEVLLTEERKNFEGSYAK